MWWNVFTLLVALSFIFFGRWVLLGNVTTNLEIVQDAPPDNNFQKVWSSKDRDFIEVESHELTPDPQVNHDLISQTISNESQDFTLPSSVIENHVSSIKTQTPISAPVSVQTLTPENVPVDKEFNVPSDIPEDIKETEISNKTTDFSSKQTDNLLLKARTALIMDDLRKAEEFVDQVINNNPQNAQALHLKKVIQNKIQSSPQDTMKNSMIQSVNSAWNVQCTSEEVESVEESLNNYDQIFEKLYSITIPQISFNNTPLSVAINTVTSLAEQYDPSPNEIERGVNIVLMEPNLENEPKVSLTLKNMSLDKILNFIAKSSLYQYDIEDNTIVFHKVENKNSFNLDTQFFKISRSAVIRMTGNKGNINSIASLGNGSDSSPSQTNSVPELSIAEEEKLIQEFFQKSGINFTGTSGSSLAFDGSQLIVTQSIRNLKRIEEILRKYETVKQVEIETKFIEVQQNTLDELQFNWNVQFGTGIGKAEGHGGLSKNPFKYSISNTGYTRTLNNTFTIGNASSGDGSIVTTNQNGDKLQTTAIPNSSPSSPSGIDLGGSAGNLLGITGMIANRVDLGLTMRALEQQSGANLMSAPKITVLSGKTAKITVAQEFIYPKTYGEIESEVGSGESASASATITAGTPSDFTTRNVGVEMQVTPIVEEDNYISLHLLPKVTEFEGFIEYGGRSIAIQGNTTVEVPPGFYQPIFATREIDTEVTIFDGATVVMGGLTREETKEVNDKIPLLGDIPLIGKLFRSKGETSQKKNLLIFVTANILSPQGSPQKKQSNIKSKNFSKSGKKEKTTPTL